MTDTLTAVRWTERASALEPPTRLVIGGELVDAADGRSRGLTTPRDGSVLADVAWGGVEDVDRAVAAARKAFDDGPWPRLHPRERGAALDRLADLLEGHREELALLISLEMGKPIRDSYGIELRAIIGCLRFYAGLADKEHGEIPPTTEGELALVTREPAGVVAAVVPWNFPLTLAGWKIGPALASGCTVVVKPAERSSLSMLRVGELALEAGLPPGVLQVVTGDGPEVGRRLGEHPDVDVLTFTGSTDVGRRFLHYAADSNLKRVYLELGGKSPNIVLADAADLDAAAESAAWAIFFNSGEMCTAGSRLVVQRDVADHVVGRIVEQSSGWAPGDPLDPETRMGPVVDAAHLERILGYVEQGVAAGARVATGGEQVRADSGGPYLSPTVLTDVDRDNPVAREEVFGPVLAVQVVDTVEEAVRVAGDTPYGLAAGLWTADLGTAHTVARALRAGTVWVNCYEEGDMSVPFGGVKLSGFGRDKSRHAMDKFSDLKTTWIKYG